MDSLPTMDADGARAASIAQSAMGKNEGAKLMVTSLPGDVERNFRIETAEGERYLLRVYASGLDRNTVDFQRDLIDHAAARDPGLGELLPIFEGDGERIQAVEWSPGVAPVSACLQRFLPGRLLADTRPHAPELLHGLGQVLGRLAGALGDFGGSPAPQAEDPSWALLDAPGVIEERLGAIPDPKRRAMVQGILRRYRDRTEAAVLGLRRGVVHQDANEGNVLVHADAQGSRVTGLIDFGDAGRSVVVADPAIAAAYGALEKKDPLGAMARIVAGFHSEYPLTDGEFSCLFELALLRLATSVAISSSRQASGEASPYQLISQGPAWRALEQLEGIHPRFACAVFRGAAGCAPLGSAPEEFSRWARAASSGFAPILGASLSDAPRLDLSIDSPFLLAPPGEEEGSLDLPMEAWGEKAERLRLAAGAAATVGYHDETRLLYGTDAFADEREDGVEARTVHLGVDLFAPASTPVCAPLGGVVLSVQRNPAPLDYGPTLILEHPATADGQPLFWTLYGHLDGEVLDRLSPGDRIEAGDEIARFGGPHENGGWPPHLHFQVYLDRFDAAGDLPGVASPSHRALWTAISPDPAALLGLDSCAANEPRSSDILAQRRRHFCSSMSISYREPIQMVKGRGTTLFDAEGRAYLDAVNNVPHVGHCHPKVVARGQRQMAMLNTNTRYLGDALVRYADKLRAKLPAHLEVIYFVSSGSEANEVALRLATAATDGATDVLVQEHGYHGHTGNTVSKSHYKFAGQGGFKRPEDVHVVPLADPFRGKHRGPESGAAYVAEVEGILKGLARSGRRPRALLAEAIIGCGGQVVPPAGYLKGAFEAVRAAGGVAIADEVQVGFGRVGTHFWAFDEQGASPDIVTMGKPIGNAHPMAAVATTRKIADAFAGGMEFFATFGGNNVSATIGEAVLDVIEEEGLVENARLRGEQFFAAMAPLKERFPFIGDVRGKGLYLGVDLVKDPQSLAPDGAAAEYVAGRMRHKGILISTDGPHHNVLKIKPPIVFTESEMTRLVTALREVFEESALG